MGRSNHVIASRQRLLTACRLSPSVINPLHGALAYRPLMSAITFIVLSSSLFAGGCSAAADSLAAGTLSVRIVTGTRCIQRIEVHLHPARNLGRATLEAYAGGWAIRPARYVFKELSPKATARSPTPQGPFADHPYQVRTFLLAPGRGTLAQTAQLRLRSQRGGITRDLALDLTPCPTPGRE